MSLEPLFLSGMQVCKGKYCVCKELDSAVVFGTVHMEMMESCHPVQQCSSFFNSLDTMRQKNKINQAPETVFVDTMN